MTTKHPSKVEVLSKKTVYRGYFQLDEYVLQHDTYDGGTSAQLNREVFERGSAAYCLPYDPVLDRVVLIEQFRPGAFAAGMSNPWMIEVVAGVIEDGETPDEVARRECQEEAGVTIGDLYFATQLMPSPGACSEVSDIYIGRVDSTDVGGIFGLKEEGEDIRVYTLPLEEALAQVDSGVINNGGTIVSILWLSRHREKIIEAWGLTSHPGQ